MLIGDSLRILGIWRETPPQWNDDVRPADYPPPKSKG
jgi:hypothetical protein